MKFHLPLFLSVVTLLSLVFTTSADAATLTSKVTRNQVSTNETFTLTVLIDEQVDSSELNLESLEKNFEILSSTPQSRSSFNVINGRSIKSASTKWTITLVAKNEGILTIPAFTIKSATSQPISIKVDDSAKGKNTELPLDVIVTTNYDEVFPNQQFIVEIELSASRNVRDLNGPQLIIANAEVEAFDQQNFQRVDNGITRQIVVLKYSVFASQAGEITIPIMTYTGLENGRRSVFGSTGTQVIARSKQLKVVVKDVPTDSSQPWLPASNVTITSNWSGDRSNLKVGDPITRSITIVANEQQASIIPPLNHGDLPEGLKSYKDQPQLETSKSSQGFIASRIESEAIVVNKPGNYILPSISIDWWNTKTNKWQTSTLEQQTLNVTGEAVLTSTETPANLTTSRTYTDSNPSMVETDRRWQIASAILALIVLIQFYFLARKQAPIPGTHIVKEVTQSEQAAWASLQTAIKSDNSRAIRSNVLIWGRHALNAKAPINLATLAQAGDLQKLPEIFKDLDQHLYNGATKPDSNTINGLLKELRKKLKHSDKEQDPSKAQLNPLYPD